MRKTKKPLGIRKRYFADCCKCTASFDADKYKDTQKFCGCGEKLTWNDRKHLKSIEGMR